MESQSLMSTELQLEKMKNSPSGWWGWLYNNVHGLNVTEPYTEKGQNGAFLYFTIKIEGEKTI